jgi:hypothetical protein
MPASRWSTSGCQLRVLQQPDCHLFFILKLVSALGRKALWRLASGFQCFVVWHRDADSYSLNHVSASEQQSLWRSASRGRHVEVIFTKETILVLEQLFYHLWFTCLQTIIYRN